MEVPTIPNQPSFGTMAPYVFALHKYYGNKVANFKQSLKEDRDNSKIKKMVIN